MRQKKNKKKKKKKKKKKIARETVERKWNKVIERWKQEREGK